MIVDQIKNAERWLELHPGFSAAFAFLRRAGLEKLERGRQEIDGQRLYAVVIRDRGKGRGQTKLETHRRYIDIQFSVENTDLIGWKGASTCVKPERPYDEQRDIQCFLDAPHSWITTPPGSFAIFFPDDAHAPMAADADLHKVIMKVAVNWE
jgi:YhcH/YjgK/YiaL family protein